MYGMFRRLGLSKFSASEVEAIYNHCVERKGYPLPTVYQGSYNPLNRYKETVFFPTLRNLGMSFYAYGSSVGGFLDKTVAQAEEMARNIALVSASSWPYVRNPKFLEALAKWNNVADNEGVSGAELAYRWVAYHSTLN
jgi:aflatoxin B1 aldehyde reductase